MLILSLKSITNIRHKTPLLGLMRKKNGIPIYAETKDVLLLLTLWFVSLASWRILSCHARLGSWCDVPAAVATCF